MFATTLAISGAAVAVLAAWQARTPPAVRGSATALYFAVVTAVGLGLGPPLVGGVSDLVASGGAGLQEALARVVVGVAASAAGLSLLLTEAGADPR